jgi:hypothetical protein
VTYPVRVRVKNLLQPHTASDCHYLRSTVQRGCSSLTLASGQCVGRQLISDLISVFHLSFLQWSLWPAGFFVAASVLAAYRAPLYVTFKGYIADDNSVSQASFLLELNNFVFKKIGHVYSTEEHFLLSKHFCQNFVTKVVDIDKMRIMDLRCNDITQQCLALRIRESH